MSESPVSKTPAPASIMTYEKIDWDKPLESAAPGTAPPKELVAQAKKVGARRKKIVRGEGGFFMNRSRLPAGYRVPTHHHNYSEMLIVLNGGCQFDDDFGVAGPDDTVVIPAKNRYGFTCGPEGMEFLTIRLGEASTEL
jgi:quercetin dioxygenase-like cupin family protein